MAMSNFYSKFSQTKRNSEPAKMSYSHSQTHWINGMKKFYFCAFFTNKKNP